MLYGTVVNEWSGRILLPQAKGDNPNFDLATARNDEGNALFLFLATKDGTLKVTVQTDGSDWDIYARKDGRNYTLGYNGGNTDNGQIEVRRGEFLMICINCYWAGGSKTGIVNMWIE